MTASPAGEAFLILQAVHQAALGDDVLDERRERGGLKGLAGRLVGDDASVKVDADRVALSNCLTGGGALQNRQTDVDGIAVEEAGKALGDDAADAGCLMATGACSREEPQPKFSRRP